MPYLPEKKFILSCLAALANNNSFEIEEDEFQSLCWPWILEVCKNHWVLAFIAHFLKNQKTLYDLPRQIQDNLKVSCVQSEEIHQKKRAQFKILKDWFETEQIAWTPLKGLSLFDLCYSNMPYRAMDDFDLLIKSQDLKKTAKLFRKQNLSPIRSKQKHIYPFKWHRDIIKKIQRKNPKRQRREYQGKTFLIDMHWRLRYPIGGEMAELHTDLFWNGTETEQEKVLRMHVLLHALTDYETRKPFLKHLLDLLLIHQLHPWDCSDQKFNKYFISLTSEQEKRLRGFLSLVVKVSKSNLLDFSFSESDWEKLDPYFEKTTRNPKPKFMIPNMMYFSKIKSAKEKRYFLFGYLIANQDYYQGRYPKILILLIHPFIIPYSLMRTFFAKLRWLFQRYFRHS